MRLLAAFDPGLVGTGWAVWRVGKKPQFDLFPIATGIIKPGIGTMSDRVRDLMYASAEVLLDHEATEVVIEWPRFFGSAKGRTAADRGDLGKLYLAASALYCQALANNIKKVELIDVNAWKGQLSKAAVIYHIKRRLELETEPYSSHEWDAIGLGLSYLGHFM